MRDTRDICFLQVRGINQFEKELQEQREVRKKRIDIAAIHKNELTGEIDPETKANHKKDEK